MSLVSSTFFIRITVSKFVVVAKYSFPLDANIAKASLESEGIPAHIADEHTVNMQWLYSDAVGGVRLFVPEQFEVEAKTILNLNFAEDVDLAFEKSPEHCPQCNSLNVVNHTKGKKPAFLIFILLGFPLFFYKHGKKCSDCDWFE